MSLFELSNIHFGYVGRPPILHGARQDTAKYTEIFARAAVLFIAQ